MQERKIFTNNNCIGCNICIANCPCGEANVAVMENGQNKIYIDPDRCIVCGECVRTCPHKAREYVDDTERFFADLQAGQRISLIVAPSLRTNFDQWENLLGYLRQAGIQYLFDSSFGADISTWSYIRYMEENQVEGLVAQPCPAIVNYIERYLPELLPRLAPVQSPIMCSAIYMRKYKAIQGGYALLSPCIAKRDEINDENNGRLIEYNITFQGLRDYLDRRHINYQSSPADSFDNDRHGLGAVYPMPGGLSASIRQYMGDVWIHQMEGQPDACDFLQAYSKLPPDSETPFLVDILSCPHGCNVGTAALRGHSDSLEIGKRLYHVKKDLHSAAKRQVPGPYYKRFDRELNLSDFRRAYTNKAKLDKIVTEQDFGGAFFRLRKRDDLQRKIDCRSCGYSTCKKMAEAVAKGINHPENCVEYIKSILQEQSLEMRALAEQRDHQAQELRENVESIFEAISRSSQQTEKTLEDIHSIHDRIQQMSGISGRLEEHVQTLRSEIDKYISMGDEIMRLSKQTNLLSLNASVEAVRVGMNGKGFAVVVEQINLLSDQSERSAKEAMENNEMIAPLLRQVNDVSLEVLRESQIISDNADNILAAVDNLSQIQQNISDFASQILDGEQAYQRSSQPVSQY